LSESEKEIVEREPRPAKTQEAKQVCQIAPSGAMLASRGGKR
jgi:hypothetical protein